jgi:hypothetical protein
MTLLRDLQAGMRLARSKDKSVHVSTCSSIRYQRINASCVEVVALIRSVSTSRRKKNE